MEVVFTRYASHDLPSAETLEPPPETWREPFAALIAELELQPTDIDIAHPRLVELLRQL